MGPGTLERIVDVARRAGALTRDLQASGPRIARKADHSPVTDADTASERLILAELVRLDPSIPVVSEEAGIPPADVRRAWIRFWLVDPLDGTKEFIQGLPDYTVNIALIERGEPVMGVVGAPAQDVVYYAAKGEGSWRQTGAASPVRIYARPPAPGTPLRIVESRSHPSPELETFLAGLPVAERLAVGSSIKFCRLAEGRADLYPRFGPVMEWDVAAGDCVFRNSSATGVPFHSPLRYGGPDLRIPGFVVGFRPPPPAVVWFTGLSGAGKTTIARVVRDRLLERGSPVELLDGDEIRAVFPTTGFSREQRDSHIRRVGDTAARLERHAVTSLVSLVSPYRASRDFVRGLCRQFVEVYVSTPLDECERRDTKGLYRQARAGEMSQLTGVDDPYEPPADPELTIDTRTMSPEEAADLIVSHLARARQPKEGPG